MSTSQEVFKRYEKKYMVTQEQYNQLLPRLLEQMTIDQYGKHTICNIYYDTPDYSLIRSSIEKPLYKEKLRLRSYGIPRENDTVFLELKKKFDGIVYKRRVAMTLKEVNNYLNNGIKPSQSVSQIFKELDFSIRKYEIQPSAYLSYERIALFGNEDPNLRLTLDENITCRDYAIKLESGSYGISLLKPQDKLMEIKIPGIMPVWMAHLLSQLEIFPTSFSKYGTYYKNYLLPQHFQQSQEKGVQKYA